MKKGREWIRKGEKEAGRERETKERREKGRTGKKEWKEGEKSKAEYILDQTVITTLLYDRIHNHNVTNGKIDIRRNYLSV